MRLTQTLLWPLSRLYALAVAQHQRAARCRPPQGLGVPVISVGNITTGGTGKTEAVAWVCRQLLDHGCKPAVLSRGYKRRSQDDLVIVSRGQGPETSVTDAGDEPFLLAQRLPGTAVVVGADRLAAGRAAIARLGCDVLVLDDGFQRRFQVHRDLDIVLVDAADPFGQDALLPAGRLREPLSALAAADILIVTRADQQDIAPVLARLRKLAPGKPMACARHRPARLQPVPAGQPIGVDTLQGKPCLAVCGIGRPRAFVRTLRDLGAKVKGEYFFPDHHWYRESDRRRLRARAARLQAEIVTTAKDAVRLQWLEGSGIRAWALEVEFDFLSGAAETEALLVRILKR